MIINLKYLFASIFLIFLLFPFYNACPQKLNVAFEHFSIDQGLREYIVSDILQDRRGFLWFATWGGLVRFDGYNFVSYSNNPGNPATIINASLITLYEDKSGIIWIGTWRGLEKFDPVTETFTHYPVHPPSPDTYWKNHIVSIFEDKSGILWVGTGDGLNIFNRNTLEFTSFRHDSTNPKSIIHNVVNTIFEDKQGELWFGTGNGLARFNRVTNQFSHYFNDPYSKTNIRVWGTSTSWINSIYEDKDGIFWLGTFGGLVKFNPVTNSFTRFSNDPKNPNSLCSNRINKICEDLSGIIWISTSDKGVDAFNKSTNTFVHYTYDVNNPSSLSSDATFSVMLDRSGTIWIATINGVNKLNIINQSFEKLLTDHIVSIYGNNELNFIATEKELKKFDPKSRKFTFYSSYDEYLVTIDNIGNLWTRGPKGGIYKVDTIGRTTSFYYSSGMEFDHFVRYLYKTSEGIVWIGTSNSGLFFVDPATHYVTQVVNFQFDINVIYEDSFGLLWVGTEMGGLYCYNKARDSVIVYMSDRNNSSLISFNTVMDIHEDKKGELWFGTNNGLNKYNRSTKSFIHIPGSSAFSILEDDHGKLWISYPKGISKFDPETNIFKNYDISYGLPANAFTAILGFKNTNGEMYFGGTNGLICFHPDSIKDNPYIPPVFITSFKIFNEEVKLDSVISEKKIVNLPYFNNNISFEFAALNYISSKKNQYAYKMEGVDNDWVYSGTRRYASYPNLEPGEYTFRVKASNNDGIWNEEGRSIAIIISPPWWKTWWAYILYFGLLLTGLYILRRYELNREALKNTIKMDEAILKEREETDRMKSRFFANISHEFRTPLTLILGPAEKIISGTSEDVSKDAKVIKRNSRRLLQLINQLLDLSKLEAGKLKLEVSKGNIVSFVKGVTLSFESLSESKDITLKLISEKEYIELFFDREKMMKIITNILSNAFKFTPEEGKISVSVKETNHNTVEIKIKDSGIGIKASELPKLFDRFYQVDSSHTREYEGTGIGLALTKELVELQCGSIRVESIQNNGDNNWTEFTLEFPLGRDHLKDDDIISELKEGEEIGTMVEEYNPEEIRKNNLMQEDARIIKEEKTIVLVVEDNYDMREYIKDSLNKKEYQIEEAVNGEQGVRKAEKLIPDLIISDLMMPKMDGNELVKILKNNEKTSHIPIILLTAKAGLDDKLEGLETGADDYLTKPFDIKELQIRIRNLISIRKMLQVKFSKIGFTSAQEVKTETAPVKVLSSIDEKFMLKVKEVIEKHIAEEEFSIEDFGSEVGMSRMQLHRKLKALTGKSASHYIRSVKLEKAKKMIEDKKGNISEIAYSLGFNSPAYFTHCFKEEFGVPPSTIIS